MKSKKAGLHPLLIILAVALASVLFVVACGGGGEATEVAQVPAADDTAAEAAAVAAADTEAEAARQAQANIAAAAQAVEAEAAAAAVAAAAAAAAAVEGGPKYGGRLVFAMAPDCAGLDPLWTLDDPSLTITQAAYDNLLMIQPDLTIKPELATSWEPNEDFTSYTFHLREGVKFHHGKDFKAEDVLFSVERMMDPVIDSPIRATLEVIEDMVVLDDYTIRFDLDAPNGIFPTYLSVFQARILPSDIDAERFHLEEFGTGPFILEEHLPCERATLVRNLDYWEEGKPFLDEIIILQIHEIASRNEALKSGDADLIWQMAAVSVPEINAHPETTALVTTSFSYIGMPMPIDTPPFDNLLVRKAMQAAMDRVSINQAALGGLGVPAYDHPIHPSNAVFASQYAPPDYDPDLARSLLEQAGYPDGIDVTLHTADVANGMIEMAVAFQESAAPAGIRVEIQREPSDGFWDTVWNQRPGLFTVVFWFGRIPDQALMIQYHSEASWNAPGYKNSVLDDLIVKARGQDLEGQKESYGEIQRILIDDVPRLVPVFQPWIYGARNEVRGVAPHPFGWPLIQDGWIDD